MIASVPPYDRIFSPRGKTTALRKFAETLQSNNYSVPAQEMGVLPGPIYEVAAAAGKFLKGDILAADAAAIFTIHQETFETAQKQSYVQSDDWHRLLTQVSNALKGFIELSQHVSASSPEHATRR